MVKKEIAESVRRLIHQPAAIRNISIIAHVDHGKSTLTDSLVARAGLLASHKAGQARAMDTRKDEQERGVTIKSTSISLPFTVRVRKRNPRANPNWPEAPPEPYPDLSVLDAPDEFEEVLVNLIDSPGHVDFSSEVTAALRVTDGAVVVIDCKEGVCVQTRTVLRQAISERIKPVLFINKLDRMIMQLEMDPEDIYQSLRRAVESTNVVISTYHDEDRFGAWTVWPQAGTVAFGSGRDGWGFTLEDFAAIYHDRFNISKKKMMKKLWGDNFWDPKAKKWTTDATRKGGKRNKRGFTCLIVEPLREIVRAVKEGDVAKYSTFCEQRELVLPRDRVEELQELGRDGVAELTKLILNTWLPVDAAMLRTVVDHLPSPLEAQRYRIERVYEGPPDDAASEAMRACDPNGPLMMYVSKMVPTRPGGESSSSKSKKKSKGGGGGGGGGVRFYAFGRVFSGTVRAGEVRIQGPEYVPGVHPAKDLRVKRVASVAMMMGGDVMSVSAVPAGNLCGLVGIDKYLIKSGTVTDYRDAHNFVAMKFSVAPVVRVAVEPANPADVTKLTLGLKALAKSDPMVQTFMARTGEHIVAGAGELHMEVCLQDLQETFMAGSKIIVSNPIVSYCESVLAPSAEPGIGKSANKHNRLHVTAEPLSDDFCRELEDGRFQWRTDEDRKRVVRDMVENFDWDREDARRIWSFGCPPDGTANVLVDRTRAVQYLTEVKDAVRTAFSNYTYGGVLAEEPLRGVRFALLDAQLHADSPHRGAGQVMPAMRSALSAAHLAAQPCLLEPVFRCDITGPRDVMGGIYSTLHQRRAEVLGCEDSDIVGSPLITVQAFLPVSESFGFTALLRENTGGEAFPTTSFSHYQNVPGDVSEEDSAANRLLLDIRARKGLALKVPQFADFHTRLH